MKTYLCTILVILSLYGCGSTKPILTEYKIVSVPQVFKTMPAVPAPPTVEEFTKLEHETFTVDYKRQRDLLKDYNIKLLTHIHGLRDKYLALIDYIEEFNEGISKKD